MSDCIVTQRRSSPRVWDRCTLANDSILCSLHSRFQQSKPVRMSHISLSHSGRLTRWQVSSLQALIAQP